MRKMAKVAVLVLMIFLVPSMCLAASGWFTCNVVQTGMSAGTTYVMLTDTAGTPAFTNQWFILDSSGTNSKQLLATCLTAISLAKTVKVYLSSTAGYANCTTCYLVQ